MSENKCLSTRLVFTNIKVDHLARYPEELSVPKSLAGLRHSTMLVEGGALLLMGRKHVTSPGLGQVLPSLPPLHPPLTLTTTIL